MPKRIEGPFGPSIYFYGCVREVPAVLLEHVVGAALHHGGGGDQGEASLFPKFGDSGGAAVAHGGPDLVEGGLHVVVEGTGVGNVGVHALLEGQLLVAAVVVPLPVPGPGAALAPVFLHVAAVDEHLVGGALVEPGEVPAQHAEVRAHGEGQRHVVILDDAAVGAHGHVDAGLLQILVPGGRHVLYSGGLAPADALGLPGDADAAAADAHLHEVGACLRQEAETVPVHYVARADLYGVAVVPADEVDGPLLPLGEAFGGVDAEHVRSGLDEGGDPLLVVPGVDARAHHVPLVVVQQLQGVVLVGVVVLAEHEGGHVAVLGDDGEGVELVLPDDVVGLLQAHALVGVDQGGEGGHELPDRGIEAHAAHPVIPAGDHAHQLPVGAAVLGDGDGGVARTLLQGDHVPQRGIGGHVGIAADEAGLALLHRPDHGRLALDALGHEDEGHAAFPGQGCRQLLTGHGLHHGGHQGDVHGQGRSFAHPELADRGHQGHVLRGAGGGRIAGNEKILGEGVGRFAEIVCHDALLKMI